MHLNIYSRFPIAEYGSNLSAHQQMDGWIKKGCVCVCVCVCMCVCTHTYIHPDGTLISCHLMVVVVGGFPGSTSGKESDCQYR